MTSANTWRIPHPSHCWEASSKAWKVLPALLLCVLLHGLLKRTYVRDGRICSGVAQPHIKASIIGSKRLRACHAIGHPADGCVQDAVHEENSVPSACKASQNFQLFGVTKLTADCFRYLASKQC